MVFDNDARVARRDRRSVAPERGIVVDNTFRYRL
jgi:hypothetical protein